MTTNNGTVAKRQTAIEPDGMGRSLFNRLPPEHQEILSKRIAVGASRSEIELFLMQTQAHGLNPFAMPPECWLIPRREQVNDQWITKYIPQMSKDGALRVAKARGVYRGHTIEHRVGGQWYADGDEPDEAPHPDRTRCTIPIPDTDSAVRFVARFKEKAQYKKDGSLTDFWKRTPFEMLAKCALVGALKLLPDAPGMEMAEEEYDDEGQSRRAFWAWADERDISEPVVRRCLQVPDGYSLGDAVERMGGWNKARVYVEAKAERVKSLPEAARGGDASMLYSEPYEPEQTANNLGEKEEPPNLEMPEASSSPRCSVDGCEAPVTGFGPNGEPLCEAHGDLAANAEPAPEESSPPAVSFHNAVDFLHAAQAKYGLADSQAVTKAIGDGKWKAATAAELSSEWWPRLEARMAVQTA